MSISGYELPPNSFIIIDGLVSIPSSGECLFLGFYHWRICNSFVRFNPIEWGMSISGMLVLVTACQAKPGFNPIEWGMSISGDIFSDSPPVNLLDLFQSHRVGNVYFWGNLWGLINPLYSKNGKRWRWFIPTLQPVGIREAWRRAAKPECNRFASSFLPF